MKGPITIKIIPGVDSYSSMKVEIHRENDKPEIIELEIDSGLRVLGKAYIGYTNLSIFLEHNSIQLEPRCEGFKL